MTKITLKLTVEKCSFLTLNNKRREAFYSLTNSNWSQQVNTSFKTLPFASKPYSNKLLIFIKTEFQIDLGWTLASRKRGSSPSLSNFHTSIC